MSFQTRWRITGLLTVKTALHIGSGSYQEQKIDDTTVKVTALVRDQDGDPYIPGATLKGNLRAWLQKRLKETTRLDSVFGSGVEEEAQGGKAEFWNVRLQNNCTTGVEVGVTIDRITRTARDQKLFHHQIVPPKVTFQVQITGTGLNEDDIALLLAGFNGFNDKEHPVRLGSGHTQNKGQMTWNLQKIEQLDAQAAKDWITQGAQGMWYTAMHAVSQTKQAQLVTHSTELIKNNPHLLTISFRLEFDTPFLVNDPSLRVSDDDPAHQPRRDHKGNVVLPSSSVRGAIRAQAERIIRTLKGQACFIDDEKLACEAVTKKSEVEQNLCLACQLFGGTGWLSPIQMSDFTFVQDSGILKQEFVAIDRFTGGGAEHLKFNAETSYKPIFEGHWTIDLQRLKPWGLGLLAILIRDLIEGDITFGYGASKGYGHCKANKFKPINQQKWRDYFTPAMVAEFRTLCQKGAKN